MKSVYSGLLILVCLACGEKSLPRPEGIDFRHEMRELVKEISRYAKAEDSGFLIIPQNGHELITDDATLWPETKLIQTDYLESIDAIGREDLFFGYHNDDEATPAGETSEIISFLAEYQAHGIAVLVTDYCSSPGNIREAADKNSDNGFLSYVAESRELDRLPTSANPIREASVLDIADISAAANFLYIINPDRFESREEFVIAVRETDYDLAIVDAFHDEEMLTSVDVARLKTKHNGGKRLVVAYLSIGEAEDYRYYWNSKWKVGEPEWLFAENKNWGGNYKVAYWMQDWKQVLFGSESAYLDRIIAAGFDGVYLDIIDGYEYFEEL